jgi:hypothetical protein
VGVVFKGHVEMDKTLRNIVKNYPKKARAALNLWAERVMTDSKENYVPVKDAVLQNSGRVDLDDDETKMKVTLSYGGAASAYAEVQHEREDFHHKIGTSGYLVKPLMAAAGTAAVDIAANAQFDDHDKDDT